MSTKTAFALAVILVSLPALASCGVNALSGDGPQAAEARTAAARATNQRNVEESVSEQGVVARAGDAKARAGDGAVARAGDAVARAGAGAGAGAVARAGDVVARANGDEENKNTGADSEGSSRKVALEVRGERGTRFSGTCSIGDEERRIGGRVPASYSFELGGKKLECEIRKDGQGALEVELAAGDDVRSVQRQAGSGSSVIHLTYSGNRATVVSSSGS